MSANEPEPGQNDTARELFDRSPRPYHRASFSADDRLTLGETRRFNAAQYAKNVFQSNSPGTSTKHNTSSDSGTEADDEKPLLKALTAPPLRSRKGLKSSEAYEGVSTQSLTPSANADDVNRLLEGHPVSIRRKSRKSTPTAITKGHQEQKKPIEVLRRLSEVFLFGAIAWLSLRICPSHTKAVFWQYVFRVSILYAFYIPLLVIRIFRDSQHWTWPRIWFPESADPAALLYPVFLPVLVILSIGGFETDASLAYVLSVCAIPRRIVPFRSFYIQWLLTLVVLSIDGTSDSETVTSLTREETVLLFPLHCALMQTLYFLTTSSLLTSELQLLSVALINLLGTLKTPQASILKALLWIGGLLMLVSCRHVLKLSVELARIPTWRLRRVRRSSKHDSTLYCAIDDLLGGFLSSKIFTARDVDSSDEDFDRIKSRSSKSTSQERPNGHEQARMLRPAKDDLEFGTQSMTSMNDAPRRGQRRHTLPGNLTALPDFPTITNLVTKTATEAISSVKTRSRLILKLTLAQAIVLKWLYAAFIYVMAVLIILLPIRLYVQYYALDAQEPVGWALGYLFGDNQWFRMQVVMSGLDSWIMLPTRNLDSAEHHGLANYHRTIVLGAANTRLMICAWCVGLIASGIAIVMHLSNIVEVDTRRKVFHFMMVAMFLPMIFIDPAFVALALILVLAIFLLLDLFRASQLPPLSTPLTYFLAPYVDGRDHKGPVIISPIFLLIGCAIPLWLSLAATGRSGEGPAHGWEVPTRDLSMVTGVICVGMGDAAASLIGRRYGRRRWPWSGGKSLEGSAAFAFAVVFGLVASRVWLVLGQWPGDSGDSWMMTLQKATIAAVGSSLTEAVLTGGNDNVVVPIILWLLTRGLAI